MNHDEKTYPLGAPVRTLGDLQALAHAGRWVWVQNASKAILAADLLAESGHTLARHFQMDMMAWSGPGGSGVPDAPKKGEADADESASVPCTGVVR